VPRPRVLSFIMTSVLERYRVCGRILKPPARFRTF
jgi:hypothetical protein